jgi:hypothetical protein
MEEPDVDIKRKRTTGGILAVLVATVVACGSIQGATGKADPQLGGGMNYLTADGSYGVGLAHGEVNGETSQVSGTSSAPGDASVPSLQP